MPMMEVTEHEEMILYGLRSMMAKNNDEQLKAVENTYFAKSKQSIFTTSELAANWGCSKKHVQTVLKDGGVKPVGKRGHEHEYDGAAAQLAKEEYDAKVLYNRRISGKLRAM